MKRRDLIRGAVASLAFAPVWDARADETEEDIEGEILSSMEEEFRLLGGRSVDGVSSLAQQEANVAPDGRFVVPALAPELSDVLRKGVRYWRLPSNERQLAPLWSKRDANPDLFHLKGVSGPRTQSFTLDVGLLQKLAKAYAFPALNGRVIVGLRGATLASEEQDSGWARSHAVRLAEPDHVNFRCLMGIVSVERGDKGDKGRIRLFQASTVPQAANMFAAMQTGGWGTSLLPAGRYQFVSGTHKATSRWKQPGALQNQSRYVSLRSPRDLDYDPTSLWDVWTYGAAHNIHAAGRRRRNPLFDSAGCQVIPGGYNRSRTRSYGPWRTFQIEAGLADTKGRALSAKRPYEYMLFTGFEAALAYHDRAYDRLRPGSIDALESKRVRRLQTRLFRLPAPNAKDGPAVQAYRSFLREKRPRPDGDFGALTSLAVLLYQKAFSEFEQPMGPVEVG